MHPREARNRETVKKTKQNLNHEKTLSQANHDEKNTRKDEDGSSGIRKSKALYPDIGYMGNDSEHVGLTLNSMEDDSKKPEPPRRSSRLLQKTRARSRETPASDETGSSGKGASRRPEALSEPYPLPQPEA